MMSERRRYYSVEVEGATVIRGRLADRAGKSGDIDCGETARGESRVFIEDLHWRDMSA